MTNNKNKICADISMDSQKLEKVTSSKYLGAILCKDGTCSTEIHIRIASEAMARFHRIWQYNTISFASKFTLHLSAQVSRHLYPLLQL